MNRPAGVPGLAALASASLALAAEQPPGRFDVADIERARGVVQVAERFLGEQPTTVTAYRNPNGAGGLHDFSSDGDYWWPDPHDPSAPYVKRDGMTNPDNFVAHRRAMIRMSIQVAALTSAYRLTGDERYARQAIRHLRAWFVDNETKMNPNLLYAQAIKGRVPGRGIGIVDTVHLIEPARAAQVLERAGVLTGDERAGIKRWFAEYLCWMTTHPYGTDEMNEANNHGTCWTMQVAAFAAFVGDQRLLDACRKRYKNVLLPNQMAADGSFPRELARTKPYNYSLFNVDAMATLCWILSTPEENLWAYRTPDGRSMREAVEYIHPFIKDKSTWPLRPDVMFWEFWPVRSPVLLFAGLAYHEPKYLDTWKALDANPSNDEVLRNLPIRYPILWVD